MFIEFFRHQGSGNLPLRQLILDGRVLLSVFVRLELLRGVRLVEQKQLLSALAGLNILSLSGQLYQLAETLIPIGRARGLNVGLVDYLIAVQALEADVPLYTLDKPLSQLARALGATLFKP